MPSVHKFILRETNSDASHVLRNPGRTTLGRARTCDIEPSEATVSKHHAVVEIAELKELQLEPTITVEDLHSRNGTYVGSPSKWIICNGKVPIEIGQYIKLGESVNFFILDVLIEKDEGKGRNSNGNELSPLRIDDSVELSVNNNKLAPGSLPFPTAEQWRGMGGEGAAVNISISTGGVAPYNTGMRTAPVNIHIDTQQRGPQLVDAAGNLSPMALNRSAPGYGAPAGLDLSSYSPVNSASNPLPSALKQPAAAGGTGPQPPLSASAELSASQKDGLLPRLAGPPMPMKDPSTDRPLTSTAPDPRAAFASLSEELWAQNQLTEKQRHDVEKLRQSLADGLRISNQALAGIVKFDEWKTNAKKIVGDSQLAIANRNYGEMMKSSEKLKVASEPSSDRSVLLREIKDEIEAELEVPAEARLSYRLVEAKKILESVITFISGHLGIDGRAVPGPKKTVVETLRSKILASVDCLLGAVETPLAMALEGFDGLVEAEREAKKQAAMTALDASGAAAGSNAVTAKPGGPSTTSPAAMAGYIQQLRQAVTKLRGLECFVTTGIKNEVAANTSGYSDAALGSKWWHDESSLGEEQGDASKQSPSTIYELLESVENASHGTAAPVSAEAAFEYVAQISKFVISSIIEEDIEAVFVRVRNEVEMHLADREDAMMSRNDRSTGFAPSLNARTNSIFDDSGVDTSLNVLPSRPVRSSLAKSLPVYDSKSEPMSRWPGLISKASLLKTDPISSAISMIPRGSASGLGVSFDGVHAELSEDGGELRLSSSNAVMPTTNRSRFRNTAGKVRASGRFSSRNRSLRQSEGGLGTGSVDFSVAISQENAERKAQVEQLEALKEQLAELGVRHQEELERLAEEAEKDRMSMRSRSALEIREIEEQRRREIEALEAEVARQKAEIAEERQLVLEEGSSSKLTRIQFIMFKALTRIDREHETKCREMFRRWSDAVSTEKLSENKLRQLRRVCRIVEVKVHQRLSSAFHKWAHAVAGRSQELLQNSERDALQESFRLRESLRAASDRLREISRAGDIHAALVAEKALNRELTNSNTQMVASLNEMQAQLLNAARIPSAEGKKLVRDVMMSRESELARSRREVRSLRDRIGQLESAVVGVRGAEAESHVNGSANPIASVINSRLGVSGALDRLDYLAPFAEKQKQALNVVLLEIQRLHNANNELVAGRQYLSEAVARATGKVSEMEMAVFILQDRLAERERRETAVLGYLQNTLTNDEAIKFHHFLNNLDGLEPEEHK